MKFLVISGIDGSGKTTVIEKVLLNFSDKKIATFYIWLRFNHYFCKIMHALARVLSLSVKKKSFRGEAWFHEFYRSELFCYFYIRMTYLDTIIGCLKLRYQLHRGDAIEYVLCDRWVPDVLVDLAVKTHCENFLDTVWYHRFMSLMPKQTMIFLVVRNESELLGCREENREDPDFVFRQNIYEKLRRKPEINVVDNSGTIDDSVKSLLEVIQFEKN